MEHPPALPALPLQALAIAAVSSVLFVLYGPGYAGIDAMWSLVWGRDLAHLMTLSESGTTTPHVLSNLLGTLLAPLGPDADRGLVVFEYLGAGALIWGVGLTAREVAGTPAGVAAAVLMLTREQLLYATRSAFLDVLAAALVVWATLMLVRWRGERLRAAVVLLALAGLLRPEPWVLLVVLVAVHWWRVRRLDPWVVAATVAVPVLWALSDVALSGDALFSLHETRRVSAMVRAGQHIASGIGERVVAGPRNLAHAPGPELLVLGGALAAALLWPRAAGERLRTRLFGDALTVAALEQLRIVTLVAAVLAAVVVAQGLTGTLLYARFLLPFAGLVCAIIGASLALIARAHLGARAGLALAAATAVLVLIAVPFLVSARSNTDRERVRYEAARSALRPGVPCTPVVVPGANFRAFAAVWTGVRGDEVVIAAAQVPPTGTYVDAVGAGPERLLLDPSFPQRRVREGAVVRSTGGWTVRSRCAR